MIGVGRGGYNHVEIVVRCDGNNVTTIGGNTGNATSFWDRTVKTHDYQKNNSVITCFIQMN